MDRNLVSNATSADDSPTPGYMLNEIARSTTGSYQANTQLQEYLISRLSKNNHNIKFKCLVIIKHVCRTGRPEFKKEMGRNVESIKECLQYKGPPDPLRGDEIYKRVREAAREALDAIYDSQMPQSTSAVQQANRIQGMGNDYTPSDVPKASSGVGGYMNSIVSSVQTSIMGDGTDVSYAGHPGATGSFLPPSQYGSNYNGPQAAQSNYSGGGGGNSNYSFSSSGMSGMGNPNFSDARNEKTWFERASEMAKTSGASAVASVYGNSAGSGSSSSANNRSSNSNNDYNYATNRGPNAINSNPYSPQQPGNAFGSNARLSTLPNVTFGGMVPDIPTGAPGTGRAGAAASDGVYEQSMLTSLCEPGGLKPVPSEDKLNAFLIASVTLSAEIVGNCLVDLLNSESWQSRVKALIVIAHLVKVNENADTHSQWWVEHLEDLQGLLGDSKAAVRTQATKTIQIVSKDSSVNTGDSNYSSPVNSSKTVATTFSAEKTNTAASGAVNLLESYDDVNYSAPTASTGTNSFDVNNNAGGGGLFDGMSLGTDSNAVQSVSVPQQQYSPVPVPVVPTNNISSTFDFLDSHDAPLPVVTPSVAPWGTTPPQPPTQTYTNVAPPSVPAVNVPVDLFDSLQLSVGSTPQSQSVVPQQSQQFVDSNGSNVNNIDNNTNRTYANDLADLNMNYHPSMPYNNGGSMNTGMGMRPYGMMPQQQQVQQGFQGQQFGVNNVQISHQQQQLNGQNRPVGNLIAPGMLSATAPRKNIPDNNGNNAGNSGFSFMGGPAGPAGSPNKSRSGGKMMPPTASAATAPDSFSFLVTDSINAMNKK